MHLFRWLLRLLLVLLGVLAALVWWQRAQLQVLALQRIDPVPQVQQWVEAGEIAQAGDCLDFFLQYDYVQNDPRAQALHADISATRSSLRYQLGKVGEGALTGQSDEAAGQVAGVLTDLMVIGDLRDLAVQGWRWSRDETTDPVLIALSTVGVAASALQVGSALATVPTAGATAPVTAGATTAKTSIAMLKNMRRLRRLPDWLGETMVNAARQVRRQRSLHGLPDVQAILADVAVLARTPGGSRMLAATTDAASLARTARFARTHGKHSATLQRIGGDALVQNAALTERMGSAAVQHAATYGQRGLRVLEQTGAVRFAKYTARASKMAWKGDIWRLLMAWLAALPTAVLAAFMLAGVLALRPRRRTARAAAS